MLLVSQWYRITLPSMKYGSRWLMKMMIAMNRRKMMLGPPALVSLAGFSLGRHFGSSDLFINGGAIPSLRNATMYTLVTYLEMQCNPLYSVQWKESGGILLILRIHASISFLDYDYFKLKEIKHYFSSLFYMNFLVCPSFHIYWIDLFHSTLVPAERPSSTPAMSNA